MQTYLEIIAEEKVYEEQEPSVSEEWRAARDDNEQRNTEHCVQAVASARADHLKELNFIWRLEGAKPTNKRKKPHQHSIKRLISDIYHGTVTY